MTVAPSFLVYSTDACEEMKRIAVCFLALLMPAHGFAQGYVCAVGGGGEDYASWSDPPYRWIVQHAPDRKIIVLSANVEDEWIPTYFRSFGADTSFNLRIASVSVANDSATYRTIKQCSGIFIKGGDQWNYVSQWRNTLTQQAIREVFLAGGVVGGTSAGAAVLGDVIFDARVGSPASREALRNPRMSSLTLTTDFVNVVPNCLFDTHFYERARFGRLLAMMGKFQMDTGRRILGVGIESETAVCISPDGTGEVMGAGSVVFYYPTDGTRIVASANQPLVYTNIALDALVAGYKYDFNTHQTSYVLPTALVPGSGTSEPLVNAISIFGDAFPSSAAVAQFLAAAGGNSVRFAVVTSPSTSTAGQRYVDTLANRGVLSVSLLLLDATGANNTLYAAAIAQAGGIVFTSNLSEQFPAYIDSTTLVGQALRAKLGEGVAIAVASQDGKIAASALTFRTELEELASYRGKLINGNGAKALRNLVVMPLIFQSDVYDWNRVSGLLWTMAQTDGKTGLYVDEGGYVSIDRNGVIQSQGPTPVIAVDTRNATYVGYSTFRHSGSVGPRQSTAITGAMIHVLNGDYRLNSQTGMVVTGITMSGDPIPGQPGLFQNYPNPFNPSTTIHYQISIHTHVTLTVFDLLGREVAALVDGMEDPGEKTATFDGSALASGVYFYRLKAGEFVQTRKLVLVR
jgi:cyanophycinase